MERLSLTPRPEWRSDVEALGLTWHSIGSAPYWNEAAAYALSGGEAEALLAAAHTLYKMYVEAGAYIVKHDLHQRFGIPDFLWPMIKEAWRREPPALNYGRFDLGFDGVTPPKLFEYNCDTPTSLLETAVVQWFWKEEVFPTHDQCNALHEHLVAKWSDIRPHLAQSRVHFAHAGRADGEDGLTTAYMMDLAREAGLDPVRIKMSDIGVQRLGSHKTRLVDLQIEEIRTLYKLYPWEWMAAEAFASDLPNLQERTTFVEPIWKMIWSNKAILPILWDLYPRHENLLWASADRPLSHSFAIKPLLSREGANIHLVKGGHSLARTDGPYEGPVIYQDLYDLPKLGGAYPVFGVWTVDGAPAGLGVREDGLITGNLARFVPHVIRR